MSVSELDIFNPILTQKYWETQATQQQINVYLYRFLCKFRSAYVDYIKQQKEKNATYDGFNDRISTLENTVELIDKSLTALKNDFTQLRTDNNNFTLSVNNTIASFQTNIDSQTALLSTLTTNVGKNASDILELKNSIDIDKLNQAIASHQTLQDYFTNKFNNFEATQNNKYDELSTNLNNLIDNLKTSLNTKLNDFSVQYDEKLSTMNLKLANTISDINLYKETINQNLESYKSNITSQINIVKNNLENSQTEYRQLIQDLKLAYQQADNNLETKIENTNNNLVQQINNVKELIQTNTNYIDTIKSNLGTRMSNLEKSDENQWNTINAILDSQNDLRDVNAKIYKLWQDLDTDYKAFKASQLTINDSVNTSLSDMNMLLSEISAGYINKDIFKSFSLPYPTTVNEERTLQVFGKLIRIKLVNTTNITFVVEQAPNNSTESAGTVLYSLNKAKYVSSLGNIPHTVTTNRQYIDVIITDILSNQTKPMTLYVETRNSALQIFACNYLTD